MANPRINDQNRPGIVQNMKPGDPDGALGQTDRDEIVGAAHKRRMSLYGAGNPTMANATNKTTRGKFADGPNVKEVN